MHFEGGEELAAALDRLSTRVSRRLLREALIEGAEPIRRRAGHLAPRAPGAPDLADNIGISVSRSEDEATIAVGPTQGFFYGLFQEYGTVHHRAQPFMRPAFESEANRALGIVGQALWRELAGRGVSRSGSVDGPMESLGGLL